MRPGRARGERGRRGKGKLWPRSDGAGLSPSLPNTDPDPPAPWVLLVQLSPLSPTPRRDFAETPALPGSSSAWCHHAQPHRHKTVCLLLPFPLHKQQLRAQPHGEEGAQSRHPVDALQRGCAQAPALTCMAVGSPVCGGLCVPLGGSFSSAAARIWGCRIELPPEPAHGGFHLACLRGGKMILGAIVLQLHEAQSKRSPSCCLY